MSLIIAENVSHCFGAQEVLKAASFRVAESDRIGLVGANGEGKTTLLRIIGGSLESTGGSVHRRHGLRLGYLPQDPPALVGSTIYGTMLDVYADVRATELKLHELAERMSGQPDLTEQYSAMQHEFEAAGGYDYTSRIERVLTGLAFPREMWDRPLSQLSGGERTRAYLATVLLHEPDLLLLDEPTNHLDLDSIEWLESWAQSFRGALVVVSHDRYLMDRVTTSTWEIAFGGLEAYRGSYSKFLTLRAERFNDRVRRWEAQQEYIEKTEEFIRIHIAGQRTREAQGRRKRLERFMQDEAIPQPQEQPSISLKLPTGRRTGDLVARATDLAVGYDPAAPLLKACRVELERGQRVAIVGPNGIGKTTLLRTLLGALKPLGGSVHHGANVSFGYLSQMHAELDPETTAVDAVRGAGNGCTAERARSLLGGLLLSGDHAFKRVGELSGGQRSRVALARLVVTGATVLALDEPTNHLDIPSMEIIQDALLRFDGTIIFVSHDRYLIQALATHVWAVDGDCVHCIFGGWEAYLKWRDERRGQSGRKGGGGTATPSKEARRAEYHDARKAAGMERRLKKRLAEIEAEIEKVECELVQINAGIQTASECAAIESLRQLSDEHRQKTSRLEVLWCEWEDVGDKLGA